MPGGRRGRRTVAAAIVLMVVCAGSYPAAHAAPTPPPAGATGFPISGDFNGDGEHDVLWYGPGSAPDHLWRGTAGRGFRGVAVTVAGVYDPLVGDFDGDGRDDVLWYGPGGAPDALFRGSVSGFTGRTLTVAGVYEPLVGDFDGDGRDDVLWYGPGAARDVLWRGGPDGFAALTLTVRGTYEPVVGDFDGDRRDDVLWYGPGDAPDVLSRGTPRGFAGRTLSVAGTYEPLVGDFDGDRRDDVLWYGPGGAGDVLWRGRAAGFAAAGVTVDGVSEPVVGDFDGDRRDDVLWYAAGEPADHVWYGTATAFAGRTATVTGTYLPLAADFDGDGRDDVFWHAPGPAEDGLWFGGARRFWPSPATIDLDADLAPPLRQDVVAASYTPFGFVAHAMGGIDGYSYTNSLEAFERNYARGFRVFEVDFVRLADGTVLAAHSGVEEWVGLDVHFRLATATDLVGKTFDGRFTLLDGPAVVQLLRDHPDAYVVADSKWDQVAIFRSLVEAAGRDPAIVERILPHVSGATELRGFRRVYPLRNYVLALYRSQAGGVLDDAAVLDLVRNYRVPAVMMWWRPFDPSLSLARNHYLGQRYTEAFDTALRRAGAVTYVHSLSDPADMGGFMARGTGVYSDEPFPPFEATEAVVEEPAFQAGVLPS